MKATEYKIYAELRANNNRAINNDQRDRGVGTDLQDALKSENAQIDEILNAVPTIAISCMCGGRVFYFDGIVKIGATMYRGAEKVNKSNGYRAVEVIDSITDKMQSDMLADSYYY